MFQVGFIHHQIAISKGTIDFDRGPQIQFRAVKFRLFLKRIGEGTERKSCKLIARFLWACHHQVLHGVPSYRSWPTQPCIFETKAYHDTGAASILPSAFTNSALTQNIFGSSGVTIVNDGRSLLAEGLLVKRTGARGRKKHFFLFNDILVWGSIIRENINCIRSELTRGGRLTSLDASFAQCFAFWRTSSKTSTSMFFQKNR